MVTFAGSRSVDFLDFWMARAVLLVAAAVGAWLTFDTRRALTKMVRFAERWSPIGPRWSINPEKAVWIWFYRIDGAVVLAGVTWMFAQHYLAR
jgi:hypothetical protein